MNRIDKVSLQFIIEEQRKGDVLLNMNDELRKQQKLVADLEKQKKKAEKKNRNNPEAEEIKRLTDQYEQEKRKLEELEREKSHYINHSKLQGITLQQLQQELKTYNTILSSLTPGSKAFGDTQEYVNRLKARIKELRTGVSQTRSSIMAFAEGFNHIGFAINNFLSLKDRFQSWARPFVDEARRLSDTVAGVAKYTGQTTAEVERMNQKLLQIDTRTSIESLDELAGAAGRLGISAERDIIGFVDAADKINTALGDDLGEGAIDAIGKMTMVFGEDKTKGHHRD